MDLGLRDRVVFVTGASRGIGAATATLLAGEGARLAISYRSDRDAAEAVADGIRRNGGEVIVVQLDLADHASIRTAVQDVGTRWGRIDVLVNNAVDWATIDAVTPGVFEDAPVGAWQPLLRSNIDGTCLIVQAVLPWMRPGRWGRIVTISSTVAEGIANFAWYAAAKAALHGLTRTLAKELGPAGMLVNVVMAGPTLTESARRAVPASRLERFGHALPIRRVPMPEDVAGVIAFLSSGANTAITGEVVRASGGKA